MNNISRIDYEYFEVFGLTEEEENELLAFYNSL